MKNNPKVKKFATIDDRTLPKKFFICIIFQNSRYMSFNKAVLLLGTSLGDKNNNLICARTYISEKLGEIIQSSPTLETIALGFTTENTFLNQTVTISTLLHPFELLDELKKIEKDMGRIYTTPLKGENYVDRIIDIDILYYNQINLQSDRLTIPHHQVRSRDFIKKLLFY